MSNKRKNPVVKAEKKSMSLMYTINVLSHLSKEEFELLHQLRQCNPSRRNLKEIDAQMQAKLQKILDNFNVKTIHEVIEIVENFNLFELYQF